MPTAPNIVLVHGAWADGSCWSGVIERLQADGYTRHRAAVPAHLAGRRRRPAAPGARRQDGPTVVVGHSYGGQIMTALGDRRAQRRRAGLRRRLRARRGRVDRRAARPGPADAGPGPPAHRRARFRLAVRGRLRRALRRRRRAGQARVMYAVQQPLAASAFGDVMGVPAWKAYRRWYLVAAGRRGDPARRGAAVRRTHGRDHGRGRASHVAMVSHPGEVADLIETAAQTMAARA